MRSRIPVEGNSIRRNTSAETEGQSCPDPEVMPPDKTKATAGNGGESQNFKAGGLNAPNFTSDV